MGKWIVAAQEAEISPGSMKEVSVERLSLLIANVGGTYHATQAECTHRGGPLPEGSLAGAIVTCPWHGSQFRLTDGAVVSEPAERPIATFPVRVENGRILVELP